MAEAKNDGKGGALIVLFIPRRSSRKPGKLLRVSKMLLPSSDGWTAEEFANAAPEVVRAAVETARARIAAERGRKK